MNVHRSPTGRDSRVGRSDSFPELSQVGAKALTDTTPLRLKRKHSSDEEYLRAELSEMRKQMSDKDEKIKTELSEIRNQMAEMMVFLTSNFQANLENTNKMSQDITVIKEQVQNIKSTIDLLTTEQDTMKSEIATLVMTCNQNEKKVQSLESNIEQIKASTSSSTLVTKKCEDIMAEIRERYFRNKNIIMAGVPEPQYSNQKEMQDSDKNEVLKIIKTISDSCPNPVKTIRLGKYNPGKQRPIKVTFASEETAKFILKNKGKIETINIFSDQTPQQQAYLKTLKEELERRTNDEFSDYSNAKQKWYVFVKNGMIFTMIRILPLRIGIRDSFILILLVLFNTVHITDMANNNMDIPNKAKKGVKNSIDKPPSATENEEYIGKCGHYEPVHCSSLNYPCITCDMSIDCRYGASYNYTCTVKPKIFCEGPKTFNRTAMCRFCYQTERWEHRCDQKANCNSLASPMKYYITNCTASDNVLCLGKRRFLKKIKCSWTAGTKWLTAMTLAITLGGFGADRFYLGHWQEGIGKLFSFGGLGVWTLVDALLIGIHHLGPADGSLYL